jgi:hypothetical protein
VAQTTTTPLRRNRDIVLLQVGQLLSTAGTSSTVIAYPLLVLALTHSPAKAGIVGFARLLPQALFGLLAGAAADRWNRKRLMLTADSVRALAIGSFAAAILLGHVAWWEIPLVAFIEGTGATFFGSAQPGALRSVVPAQQLPAAVGVRGARVAAVSLAGPPLGGALFGIGRSVPFVADAASYAFSFASLLAMRTPFQEARAAPRATVRADVREGLHFLWAHPFLRTTALLYGLGNFLMPGVLLVVVVVGRRQGLSGGEVGALVATLGAAALAGSLASALYRRVLSIRAILLLELWTWLGCWVFVLEPSVYALLAIIVPFGIAAPVTDSVVEGYRIAMTPDRLVGRVEAARSTISLLIAPLGPLVVGFLLDAVSARTTVAVFAGFGLVLAAWGTLSPAIRAAPSLDDLETLAAAPAQLT